MTDRSVVRTIAGGLVLTVLLGLGGLLWLAADEAEIEVGLLSGLVAITAFALGGLVGLLVNSSSVDVEAVSDRAKSDALAEVEALGPNLLGQGD